MGESKFTGGLLGLIGIGIVSVIVAIITLGFGIPWTVCYKQRWYAEHTYIDGKQLVFKGTAMGLFGQYIKWFLLTIITIGIYGFWLNIKLHQWVVANTTFAN